MIHQILLGFLISNHLIFLHLFLFTNYKLLILEDIQGDLLKSIQ
jgi:hypothetical protein